VSEQPKPKAEKPQPKTVEQELKEVRQIKQMTQKDWDAKRQEMIDGRKASINESISALGRQMTELNRHKKNVKAKAREIYDEELSEAQGLYNSAVSAAKAQFDTKALELKKSYDGECQAANQTMQLAVLPLNKKHADNLKGIEKDFGEEVVVGNNPIDNLDDILAAFEAKRSCTTLTVPRWPARSNSWPEAEE
jgi:hypothetical protein